MARSTHCFHTDYTLLSNRRYSVYFVQIASFYFGRFLAARLPEREVGFGRFKFQLNPGPFSVKEHVAIVLAASTGATNNLVGLSLERCSKVDPLGADNLVRFRRTGRLRPRASHRFLRLSHERMASDPFHVGLRLRGLHFCQLRSKLPCRGSQNHLPSHPPAGFRLCVLDLPSRSSPLSLTPNRLRPLPAVKAMRSSIEAETPVSRRQMKVRSLCSFG